MHILYYTILELIYGLVLWYCGLLGGGGSRGGEGGVGVQYSIV